jgi:hypothetical protein
MIQQWAKAGSFMRPRQSDRHSGFIAELHFENMTLKMKGPINESTAFKLLAALAQADRARAEFAHNPFATGTSRRRPALLL